MRTCYFGKKDPDLVVYQICRSKSFMCLLENHSSQNLGTEHVLSILMYLVTDGVPKTATSRGTNGATRTPNCCVCTPPSCGSITGLPRSSGLYCIPIAGPQANDSWFFFRPLSKYDRKHCTQPFSMQSTNLIHENCTL